MGKITDKPLSSASVDEFKTMSEATEEKQSLRFHFLPRVHSTMQWTDELAIFMLSPKQSDRLLAQDLILKHMPHQLCRYLPASERTLGLLRTDSLWASNPDAYADQTDTLWYTIDRGKLMEGLHCSSEHDCQEYIFSVGANAHAAQWHGGCRSLGCDPERGDQAACFSEFPESCDDIQNLANVDDEVTPVSCVRTISFCGSPFLANMWQAYAGHSQGICVVYESDYNTSEYVSRGLACCHNFPFSEIDNSRICINLFPMIYTRNKSDITDLLIAINNQEIDQLAIERNFVRFLSLLKNSRYSPESEWRMIDFDILQPGVYEYGLRATRIYLGARCHRNRAFEKDVCSLAREKKMEVWQMRGRACLRCKKQRLHTRSQNLPDRWASRIA